MNSFSTTAFAMLAFSVGTIAEMRAKCQLAANSTHEAIDLNSLHKTDVDYSVNSDAFPDYVYKFNLCGETIFRDSTCTEGATVCQLQNDAALSVFGFVDTIHLAYVNTDVVMSMTGSAVCPFDADEVYTSDIYFICDDVTSIAIKSEQPTKCHTEIAFHAPEACAVKNVLYKCKKNACEVNDKGKYTMEECIANCDIVPPPSPPPSPPPTTPARYSCFSNFTCLEVEDGSFGSESDCDVACKPFEQHFSCFNERCVHDPSGIYAGEKMCQVSCQPFKCVDFKCVADTDGPYHSHENCETSCIKPTPPPYPPAPPAPPGPMYSCFSNFSCLMTDDGNFRSEEQCDQACQPVRKSYSCFQNRCVHNPSGPFLNESSCTTACANPKYKCDPVGYTCALSEDGTGAYQYEDACTAECHDPADKLYHCDESGSGTCIESADGIPDQAQCNSMCTSSVMSQVQSFYNRVVLSRDVDLQ